MDTGSRPARDRLLRLRRWLIGALVIGLVLEILALIVIGGSARRWVGDAADGGAGTLVQVAVLVGILALTDRRARLIRRVDATQAALFLEHRIPALRWALVAAAELPSPAPVVIERAVASMPLEQVLRSALAPRLRRGAALLGVAIVLALVTARRPAQAGAATRGTGARPDAAASRTTDPLAAFEADIIPPSHTGLSRRHLVRPSTIAAPEGSRVLLRGAGDASTVHADDGTAMVVRGDAERWRLEFSLAGAPRPLRLRAGGRERLVILEPRADSAPVVTLDAPATDTVLVAGAGTIPLRAAIHDDWGLGDAAFEVIVSAGFGENFTFRTTRVGARAFPGTRDARLAGALPLDSLALEPGDLVHVRAVARDRNAVRGAALGVSETRTLRVLRRDERDAVAVEGAPPPEAEAGVLSQRMLLILTEALAARQPKLPRADVIREAGRIAIDQSKLRKRVGGLIYQRLGGGDDGEHAHFAGDGHAHGEERPLDPEALLAAASRATGGDAGKVMDFEGDETPVVAVNKPLLEAYNAMWAASTALETGAPRAAIPPMRVALAALQRARAAERIYLRGKAPRVVVDLEKARLAGKERGTDAARAARAAVDPERARRLGRFDAALDLLPRDAAAALDSLRVVRLATIGVEPATSAALGAAVEALAGGRDATRVLANARRLLAATAPRRGPLGAWHGAWPGGGPR